MGSDYKAGIIRSIGTIVAFKSPLATSLPTARSQHFSFLPMKCSYGTCFENL
jgi:hypothetical protein